MLWILSDPTTFFTSKSAVAKWPLPNKEIKNFDSFILAYFLCLCMSVTHLTKIGKKCAESGYGERERMTLAPNVELGFIPRRTIWVEIHVWRSPPPPAAPPPRNRFYYSTPFHPMRDPLRRTLLTQFHHSTDANEMSCFDIRHTSE